MKMGSQTFFIYLFLALFFFANFVVLNNYIRGMALPNVINGLNSSIIETSNSSTSVETTVISSASVTTIPTPARKFPIVFDDPKTYKGPIVLGWPPDANRNMSVYLNNDEESSNNKSACLVCPDPKVLEGSQILVVVHTKPDAFPTRMSIRNTWGRYLASIANNTVKSSFLVQNVSIIFLFGNEQRLSENHVLQLHSLKKWRKEVDKFGDILMVEMVEHYNNLTLKTMQMLKYFRFADNFENEPPKFLFKVDDDVFLNLPFLAHQMLDSDEIISIGEEKLRPDEKWIFGCLLGNGIQGVNKIPKSKMSEKWTEKWWCPTYMYNGNVYPPILSGSGYVMSRPAAECLYDAGLTLPFFHLEDVFITGFAAEICNVPRIHHKGFHNIGANLNKVQKDDVLFHYIDSLAKIDFFNKFAEL